MLVAEWCINSEVIVGPVKEISFLYLSMYRWLKDPKTKVDDTDTDILEDKALYRIAKGAGLDINTWQFNRGHFEALPELKSCDSPQGLITFVTQTTWDPVPEVWREILKRCAPNCQYYYLSICDILNQFKKYDPTGLYFPEKYYISGIQDHSDDSELSQDIAEVAYEEENLLKLLSHLLQQNKSLQELIDIFNNRYGLENYRHKNHTGDYLQIYEIEEEEYNILC